MSNYKDPQDQSPTYLQRQSQAWCKVHKERVRSIIKQKRLCMDAKLLYMGLLTYLHDGGGVLIESKERVAKSLGFTKERIDYCIAKLEGDGWLEVSKSGMIFEPVVYKYITGREHPDDAECSRISQDLAKSGRILHSSSGETSPLDKIRASSLDASNAASKERSDSLSHLNEEDRKSREGSLGVASSFSALKLKDIEEVRAVNPTMDWSDMCSLFIEKNQKTQPGLINLQWFERFVAGYAKRQGVATASPGPASESIPKPKKTLPKLTISEKEEWIIGQKKVTQLGWGDIEDFQSDMRAMPRLSLSDAIAYVRNLVDAKFQWDVEDALTNEDNWSYFFHWFNNDEVAGDDVWMDYENESEKADRKKLAEERKKAELLKTEEKTKGSRPFRASYLRNLNGKTIQDLLSMYKGNGWPTHIEIIMADVKEAEEKQYIVLNDDRTKIYGTEAKKQKEEAAIA